MKTMADPKASENKVNTAVAAWAPILARILESAVAEAVTSDNEAELAGGEIRTVIACSWTCTRRITETNSCLGAIAGLELGRTLV